MASPRRAAGSSLAPWYRRPLIGYPDPPLVSERIALRMWRTDDMPLVREASRDPGLVRMTTLPDPFTDAGATAYIERQWRRAEQGEGLALAIEHRETARALGSTTLMLRRPAVGDLGYWLVQDARGRGIGSEAVALIVPWAFDQLTIEAIEAFVHPENTPSRRILAARGFAPVGTRRYTIGRLDEDLLVYRRER